MLICIVNVVQLRMSDARQIWRIVITELNASHVSLMVLPDLSPYKHSRQTVDTPVKKPALRYHLHCCTSNA